jgi:hypothetical protein
MKVKITSCKGDKIEFYCIKIIDSFEIKNNHLSLYKNGIQIANYPARYFAIEVID